MLSRIGVFRAHDIPLILLAAYGQRDSNQEARRENNRKYFQSLQLGCPTQQPITALGS